MIGFAFSSSNKVAPTAAIRVSAVVFVTEAVKLANEN
jgi:hypothetical protein